MKTRPRVAAMTVCAMPAVQTNLEHSDKIAQIFWSALNFNVYFSYMAREITGIKAGMMPWPFTPYVPISAVGGISERGDSGK